MCKPQPAKLPAWTTLPEAVAAAQALRDIVNLLMYAS
jgi:hypothetical protein